MITESFVQQLTTDLTNTLQTHWLGRTIRWHDNIGSTNEDALAWAQEGAPDGALVLSEYQTHGRGRQGRAWESTASKNILFSLIVRPQLPHGALGLVTVATSLALAETIDRAIAPLKTKIKWPNDILIEEKKCCGMLLETAYPPDQSARPPFVVLGVGLNVNQAHFSPDISHKTTSLLLETGRRMDRIELLAGLLGRLERRYDRLAEVDAPRYIEQYEERLAYLDERITLRLGSSGQTISGMLRGISEGGALRLETAEGMAILHAGEVTTSGVDPKRNGAAL